MGSVDDGQGGTMPELTINAGAEEGKKPTVDSASKRENPKCNGTEVEEDGDEDEEQLSRPIVVPSQEQMRNYKLSPRPGELVNDTDYLGSDTPYFEKGDIPKQPSHIHEVTSTLEEAGISNCIVGVWALNFYGTKRVGDDIHITVPTDLLSKASSRLISKAIYSQVPHTGHLYSPNDPFSTYPRLKRQGVNLFLILIPTSYTCISLPPHTHTSSTKSYKNYIIYQKGTNIPFPTLSNIIQSYLDARNEVDLADIVDGLNIPLSWADKNEIDFSYRASSESYDAYRTYDKRAVWNKAIEGRRQRMGYKYPEEQYVTRFMSRKKWEMILDGEIEMPGYSPRRGDETLMKNA